MTVRVEDRLYAAVAKLVGTERYPTQSDLTRTALRLLVATEKRRERQREVEEYVRNRQAMREMADLADADIDEAVQLLARFEG